MHFADDCLFVHLLFFLYLLLKESVAFKDVIQSIVAGAAGNLITSGALGHIQTERPLSADRVALHPNQLDPADAGVLPRVFCEALRFSKVILPCRIVRLQNVYNVVRAIAAMIGPLLQGRPIHMFLPWVPFASREQCFGAWTNLVFFMSAGTFRGKCLIEGDGVVHREFVA